MTTRAAALGPPAHAVLPSAPELRLLAVPEPAPALRAGQARVGADELLLLDRPAPARPPAPCPEAPGPRFDALRAIHACYAAEASTAAWLHGVLAALAPLAPTAPWFAWSDALAAREGGAGLVLRSTAALAGEPAVAAVAGAVGREAWLDLVRPRPPVQLLSHRLRALPSEVERRAAAILRERGMAEAVLLFAGELGGDALVIGMGVAPGCRPPSRTIGLLRHVAGHLATARRLREGIRLPAQGGAARAGAGDRSIAPRVVSRLRERGELAWLERAEAEARWRDLAEGRYALLDHWVEAGRHLVLARRCLDPGDPAALRAAEVAAAAGAARGRSPAELAPALGVSPATVALHLGSARARLRCGSRRELAALLAGVA